jgi:hypothetical protein
MPKVDYIWYVLAALVIIVIIAWGPASRWFREVRYEATNQEQYERGEKVFYDGDLWAGTGTNKSCAACHAADFQAPAGATIEMQEYVAGEPHILKGISKKYGNNLLSSDDKLYDQILKCLTNPARMSCGKVSRNAKHMQDLLVYVRRQ